MWAHRSSSNSSKDKKKVLDPKVHDLAKRVEFRCVFCCEMQAKAESQVMAESPECPLDPCTPPLYYTSCVYFGPYHVKVGRNKTTKYGVIFTCLNTRAAHLELAVDCSTMEFIRVLQRLFSVRGQPSVIISDNGTQFVGTFVDGTSRLREFSAEKGVQWRFTTRDLHVRTDEQKRW